LSLRAAYREAGVDVEAGERAVDMLRTQLKIAETDVLGGIGGFGAALAIPPGYLEPILVTATDGVGTKAEIARQLGRLDTIGIDLVAMCADDVVCHGARPAFFLDYLAVGKVDPERVNALVAGVSNACDSIGCTLVGGETAEHPGVMGADAFDLAGFCIGFVEREELIDRTEAQATDAILGLASSGLHANGYSLVRRLIGQGSIRLEDIADEGQTYGEVLLTPTRLYAPAILALLGMLRAQGLRSGGLAHITGGGLAANLPRAVGDDLGVRVHLRSWTQPPIFETLGRLAGVGGAELRATFNCGIGFAVVLEEAAVKPAIALLAEHGIDAWRIGEVRTLDDLRGERYAEVA
jgi:phosphoribosylformylglycinamidine cyclo-ligase